MRRRPALLFLIPLVLIGIVALAAALGPRGRDRAPPPRSPPATHAPALPRDLAASPDLGGPMIEVLPMHQAVRLAARRFHGKPLDVTLVAPRPDEAAAGVTLVYRVRMLTRSRDVLDIRMDALDGRFLELSGSDLAGVHRNAKDKPGGNRKDKDKDD